MKKQDEQDFMAYQRDVYQEKKTMHNTIYLTHPTGDRGRQVSLKQIPSKFCSKCLSHLYSIHANLFCSFKHLHRFPPALLY